VLPRSRAAVDPALADPAAKTAALLLPRGLAFLLVAAAFASYAFVPSALSAHLLAIFGRSGIDAATVVLIGALFGPAQVAARLTELVFGRGLHPLTVARFAVALLVAAFAMLALFGISAPTAAAFALMFGAANGLVTIARGAVPLALFGATGYGAVLGVIATPVLVVNAASPTVFAWIVDRWGWGTGRVALLVSCAASWLAMEMMSRWYERQRAAAAVVDRPPAPVRAARAP
jgi:MFS family permease